MKKILLSVAAVMAFGFAAQAQDGSFTAGIHVGAPIGDAGDVSSFNFGVDVAYLWNVADDFKVGATTGYTHFLGKDIDETIITPAGPMTFSAKVKDFGFIPVAATAKYSLTESFFVGADLGYAIYAGSGDGDGGFYYQPKVGYQMETIDVFASYKGISQDGVTISTVGVGAAYKF